MMVVGSNGQGVRVRFAASPAGSLHLGSALVALANVAFARANDGCFVLRVDDIHQSRSHEEDAFGLLRTVRWLGLDWDEGPVHQRERASTYEAATRQLVEGGHAYPCFCGTTRLQELREQQVAAGRAPRYDGRCRTLDPREAQRSIEAGAPHVLRFAVPRDRSVAFDDLVRGRIEVPADALGDPVLRRADGRAGDVLASVVDDVDLAITHVIRSDQHLAGTACQVLLLEALDAPSIPALAHVPQLRDTDGGALSERDPLGTLDELVDEGFLPVTIRRYLAELLGQAAVDPLPAGGGIGPAFSFARVPVAAPRVDRARLEALGRQDMADLDVTDAIAGMGVAATAATAPLVRELAAAAHSRVALRGELRLVLDGPGAGDLPYVLGIAAPDASSLEAMRAAWGVAVDLLRDVRSEPDDWAAGVLDRLHEQGRERGVPDRESTRALRIALTGTVHGPRLALVLTAIGRKDALRRLHVADMVTEELAGVGGGNRATFG